MRDDKIRGSPVLRKKLNSVFRGRDWYAHRWIPGMRINNRGLLHARINCTRANARFINSTAFELAATGLERFPVERGTRTLAWSWMRSSRCAHLLPLLMIIKIWPVHVETQKSNFLNFKWRIVQFEKLRSNWISWYESFLGCRFRSHSYTFKYYEYKFKYSEDSKIGGLILTLSAEVKKFKITNYDFSRTPKPCFSKMKFSKKLLNHKLLFSTIYL